MDVIFHAADLERWRILIVARADEVAQQVTSNFGIAKIGNAVLRREDEVQVDLSERLRHGSSPVERSDARPCRRDIPAEV